MEASLVGFRPFTEAYGFVLNSRSLRTKEYTREPAPGVQRILAFGDSFTWASGGLPHRQHWPTILERLLNQDHDRPVEVLRFGVPATGPAFQIRLWELEGSTLHADTVILAFFVGNDFIEHQTDLAADTLGPENWKNWILHRSFLFRAFSRVVTLHHGVENGDHGRLGLVPSSGSVVHEKGGYEIPGYAPEKFTKKPRLKMERYFGIEARRMNLCLRPRRSRFEEKLRSVSTIVLRFRNEVEAEGARFIVMIIPDEYQISPAIASEVLKRSHRSLDEYDLDLPQRRLGEVLSAAGVEYLDLLPVFKSRSATIELYNRRDTHWNYAGNILAAETLAAALKRSEDSP